LASDVLRLAVELPLPSLPVCRSRPGPVTLWWSAWQRTGLTGIARSRRCSVCLCQTSCNAKAGHVTLVRGGLGVLLVFSLIRAALWLLLLPLRIFWEIAEFSGHHRRYHCHRQRAPGHRSVPSMQRQPFALGQQGPAGPRHRRSLPPRHKVLIVAPPLAFVLLIAMALAIGPPGPPSSPPAHAPTPRAGPAAGIAAAQGTGAALVQHHPKRHHRNHRVAAPPAPAPIAARCHPITASGNCYKPGEFCSHADAGMTGVAGDGEKIICEKNRGWRWEPA
jgi:hypothetical protein